MTERASRVGLLGCGRIGRVHADLLAGSVADLTLAAVFDPMSELAEEVGGRLRVPVAQSAQELVDSADIDAVAVCTSTDTHAELVVAAAKSGKAIFCEKPVSLNLDEVDRALAAVDEAGVLLHVGFNRRFDPGHRAVRDAVAAGEIGDVHLVRISSRDPLPPPLEYAAVSGGLFLDMTIHDFDMARFVTGSEVEEVYAQGAIRIVPELREFGDIDTAVVQLRHANGCLTLIDNSRQAVYGYDQRVEAFGSAGVARSENPALNNTVVYGADGGRTAGPAHSFVVRYRQSYQDQWSAFAQALRTGGPAGPGGDARAPLVIAFAALQSHREHRPITLTRTDHTTTQDRNEVR